MSVRNRNRKLKNPTYEKSSIGSIFITLALVLVVGVVLSFIMWNMANTKVLAANSFNTDPSDVEYTDEKIVIDAIEYSKLAKGEELGTLKIPSINLEYPIYVGDSDDEFAKGIGMDLRQKYPGENGNVVLAGHTNLVFKTLGEAKDGDEVIVDTYYATFIYKIASHEIVQADDQNVIVSKDTEFLTLYTCYPFDFLASTDKRYVVRCDFVERTNKNEIKA